MKFSNKAPYFSIIILSSCVATFGINNLCHIQFSHTKEPKPVLEFVNNNTRMRVITDTEEFNITIKDGHFVIKKVK